MPVADVRDFHSHDTFLGVGAVHELRGHQSTGLSNHQFFWENLFYADDNPGSGDRFEYALAAGDLDANGRDDLAIGAPGDLAGLQRAPYAAPCESPPRVRPGRFFTVKHTAGDSYVYSSYLQGDSGVPGEAEMEDALVFQSPSASSMAALAKTSPSALRAKTAASAP